MISRSSACCRVPAPAVANLPSLWKSNKERPHLGALFLSMRHQLTSFPSILQAYSNGSFSLK